MAERIDEFGTPGGLQPLRGRLGARDGHAVPVDEAGRLALGRHPQRHDRALAEGHRGARRGAQPVPPRDRRRSDGARSGRAARAQDGPRCGAEADRGREHALRLRRRRRGRAARDAVLRDVLQPRHLRQGLDRGDPALDAVGSPRRRGRSPTTPGSSTTRTRTGARRTTSRPRCPRSSTELKALFMEEATQVQRAAARRPPGRALQLRPRRAPDADHGQLAAAVRGHGAAERERGDQRQEQVALGDRGGHGPGRRRGGRDRRPGRRVRRLEPLRQGRQAEVLLQPVRRPALRRSRARRRSRRAPTRCAWSSPTTAAGSARAARSSSTSTARRPARAASRAPSR